MVDRVIQQAITQVLTPIYEPQFSDKSYGFRPKRSAHDALKQCQKDVDDGYRYVVDMDLEKFFDTVSQSKLIQILSETIKDGRVISLIHKYLNAGVVQNGLFERTEIGVPQGGPLSPLLSNVMLNELDKELERRGHRYCPYGKTATESQCPTGIIYGSGELEGILFNAITAIVQATVTDKLSSKEMRHRSRDAIQEKLDLLSSLQAQSEKQKKLKLKLYEQYTSCELARQSYLEQKKAVDKKIVSTAEEIDTLETMVAELEAADTNHETAFEQSCNTFFGETALSYESAHAFVKAVYVFSDKRVEIHWKFKDVFGEIYQA